MSSSNGVAIASIHISENSEDPVRARRVGFGSSSQKQRRVLHRDPLRPAQQEATVDEEFNAKVLANDRARRRHAALEQAPPGLHDVPTVHAIGQTRSTP